MSKNLEALKINDSAKVLFIYPHPDDETYANAGLLKILAGNKILCRVVCLTKGSKSTLTFGVGDDKLDTVREKEFRQVMNFLNIQNYEILDFEDGTLENTVNLKEVITSEIKKYNPTHVVTYEPNGIYGHPDHIVTSEIISQLQKEYPYTLLYSTVSKYYKPSKSSLKMAKNPKQVKPLHGNKTLRLSLTQYISKIKALRMYKSQVNIKNNFFHNIVHLIFLSNEYYFEKLVN